MYVTVDVACLHFKIFPTALADPAGYPIHLMYIYPPAVQSRSATSLPVRLPPVYPTIELCAFLCPRDANN
jgi:hypothetical protein